MGVASLLDRERLLGSTRVAPGNDEGELGWATSLCPPARFSHCRFANFVANPDFPGQLAAVTRLQAEIGGDVAAPTALVSTAGLGRRSQGAPKGLRARLLGKSGAATQRRRGLRTALYLDGGYGVGKTHLLAAAWHAAGPRRAYVTFSQLVAIIGLHGMARATAEFAELELLAIDEFELDDVAQTLMVVSFLRPVIAAGVRVVVTSNSLPDRLGEGRFAAADFTREIAAIASHFEVIRIDGPDYRRRESAGAGCALDSAELLVRAQLPGATLDVASEIHALLRRVHPARLPALLEGVNLVALQDLAAIDNQGTALLFVQLVDRIYDSGCGFVWSGIEADELFDASFRHGGYRKKYGRCESRLSELASEQRAAVGR